MPIRQYFLWVGSVLLAALFVVDWSLPAPSVGPSSEVSPRERVNLRIRSDHKWPERIVFDTSHPGLALTAGAAQAPGDLPTQELAGSRQHGPLDAFAATESTQAVLAATNDKASATQAKSLPVRFRMARTIKVD
jgi:hypothetical protein